MDPLVSLPPERLQKSMLMALSLMLLASFVPGQEVSNLKVLFGQLI
jgi:hypothetical protein